jgi:hypothetical protein
MTVTDYCRKQKVLADEINALSMTITDQKPLHSAKLLGRV